MKVPWLLLAACGGATTSSPVGNVAPSGTPVHAVLVIHPAAPEHAYVLGCRRGGASVATDECARLLVGTSLDLVTGTTRLPVQITGTGRGSVCPSGDEPDEPYVTLRGLPATLETPAFLVSSGRNAVLGPARVPAAVASKHGPVLAIPTKGMDLEPPEVTAIFRVDLEGDAQPELVVEQLGQYLLYDAVGTRLGTVGCAFG